MASSSASQNFSLLQKTTSQPSPVRKFWAGTSDWWPESATRSACQSRLSVQIAKYDSMLTAVSSRAMSMSRPTPLRCASHSPAMRAAIEA